MLVFSTNDDIRARLRPSASSRRPNWTDDSAYSAVVTAAAGALTEADLQELRANLDLVDQASVDKDHLAHCLDRAAHDRSTLTDLLVPDLEGLHHVYLQGGIRRGLGFDLLRGAPLRRKLISLLNAQTLSDAARLRRLGGWPLGMTTDEANLALSRELKVVIEQASTQALDSGAISSLLRAALDRVDADGFPQVREDDVLDHVWDLLDDAGLDSASMSV